MPLDFTSFQARVRLYTLVDWATKRGSSHTSRLGSKMQAFTSQLTRPQSVQAFRSESDLC